MIAWIQGVVLEKRPPVLLLNVRGVGYELEAPMSTFSALPTTGQEATLFTHQLVREDAHQLYGFTTKRDRDVFRLLLKVSGVGAKLGLAILSGMDTQTLGRCVLEGDTASLSRLPGIGKKTAERIILDMRDRLAPADGADALDGRLVASAETPLVEDPVAEAVNALVALGLKPQEASRRVRGVSPEGRACEDIVRLALQGMVR